MNQHQPEIALIGGGTGSFTLLNELKNFTYNITAIVNMSDDGGSSGVMRDELGVLPPGDVRQCMVALSDSPEVRDLFSYRFNKGRFEGQSLGNIILSGLELRYGSFDKAIRVASDILHITGKVVPATLYKHTLVMNDGNEIIRGEYRIGHRVHQNADAKVSLNPPAEINPRVEESLERADIIVIAPGNLYGSLLPIFAVNGMAEVMQRTKALKVSVTNLVTKPGQTDNWHVVDYVKQFERYIGKDQIDTVLYNNAPIHAELLNKYAAEGEFPVDYAPSRFHEINARAIGAPLISSEVSVQDAHDHAITRTLLRHDALKVGTKLMHLLETR
ncbi:MAG: hypothetical protein NVSMB46_09460 [Candidatus Saccharimonadales bacterium]